MINTSSLSVIAYAFIFLSSILILKFLSKPLKIIFFVILRAILGCGAIILINTLSTYTGVCIALNGITALICGILGSGGIVFLIFYSIFL